MPLGEVSQLRIDHGAFALERCLANVAYALCHPVASHGEAILTRNVIEFAQRVRHGFYQPLLLTFCCIDMIAQLRHHDVAPDTLQLVDIDNDIALERVCLVGYHTHTVANLRLAEDATLLCGLNDGVANGVAAIGGKEHQRRVVAALTGQSIHRPIANHPPVFFCQRVHFLFLFAVAAGSQKCHHDHKGHRYCLCSHSYSF